MASVDDFWVVVGTASPVIALAAVVQSRDAMGLMREKAHSAFAPLSYGASTINVLGQALVLLSTLHYLYYGTTKFVSATYAASSVFMGVLTLLATAFSNLLAARHGMRADGDARNEDEQKEPVNEA